MDPQKKCILDFKGRKIGLRHNENDEFQIINKKLFDNIIEEEVLFPTKRNLAFIHFGKCAGVYINKYLINNILIDEGYRLNNSWWKYNQENKSLKRDYTEKELLKIMRQGYRSKKPFYVHNHHNNWNEQLIRRYSKLDWLTFMFIREPKDLICSLYFFAKDMIKGVNKTPIGPNGVLAGYQHYDTFAPLDPNKLTLDEFILEMLSPEQQIFWKLPDYVNKINYVKEFNSENFEKFLYKFFRHQYKPNEPVNKSSNKGYRFYKENGLISEETEKKFNSHPEYAKYLEYLD